MQEKRKYNPSLELAFKLAKLFDVKLEDIFIMKMELRARITGAFFQFIITPTSSAHQ